MRLDLDLLEAVLPDGGVGGDTILTVVDEDDPIVLLALITRRWIER